MKRSTDRTNRSDRSMIDAPFMDSLQLFQLQLDNCFTRQRQRPIRTKTQSNQSQNRDSQYQKLKSQIQELKLLSSVNKQKPYQDRLDKLINQISLTRQMQKQLNNRPIYPQIYPPYPPPYLPAHSPPEQSQYKSTTKPKPKRKRGNNLLRKYFLIALFTIYIRSETKRLSRTRRSNLRAFYTNSFDPLMRHLKNWLLECHSYAFSIVLEKQNVSFDYFTDKRDKRQKQDLVFQIVKIGTQKMVRDCTSQKLSSWIQLLVNICRMGSWSMSRFWTSYEMEHITISEEFGFFRLGEAGQKALVALVVIVKVLIYNMLLQPYKFDREQFNKKNQILMSNMAVIGAVYYACVKECVEKWFGQERQNKIMKQGNWLDVQKEYIVQCSEPLLYQCQYPEQGEYISGMAKVQTQNNMKNIKENINKVIDTVHKQMLKKSILMKKNLKYKLYK